MKCRRLDTTPSGKRGGTAHPMWGEEEDHVDELLFFLLDQVHCTTSVGTASRSNFVEKITH